MEPLVSVIIPNFNNSRFILEAINSVILQDYENIEIIVVDDGSTDNSVEVLSNLSSITLLSSINLGAASARNIGILAAKGEYIALLDSDDVWERNKISLQLKFLLEHELDLVYCSGKVFGDSKEHGKVLKAEYEGECYDYFKKYPSRAIVQLGCSGAIFKKIMLSQVGLFDMRVPGPTEDWDFFRRFSRRGRIGFCSEVLVHYRRHENNTSEQSVQSYYLGNTVAILKMLHEDSDIGFFEKRLIWARFQFSAVKTFAKYHNYFQSLVALMRVFLPLP